jgi:hypothetical protein
MDSVMAYIGCVNDVEVIVEEPDLRKMADKQSEEWKLRFIRELKGRLTD